MLIYSITHYFKNNVNYVKQHINKYNKLVNHDKIFVLCVMINDINKRQFFTDKYTQLLTDFFEKFNNNEHDKNSKFKIIVQYNWGGTIAGLWYTYKYALDNFKSTDYLAHFEEDFKPKNNSWYTYVRQMLDNNQCYIYIGETNRRNPYNKNEGIIKYSVRHKNIHYINNIFSSLRIKNNVCGCKGFYNFKQPCKCNNQIYGLEVWTDGGFYFSTIERLKKVEDRIGIFHKGNKNMYDHDLDGIELGEVGFPTMLYYNGFNFGSLYRQTFFKHY